MSAIITNQSQPFMRELVTKVSDRHYSPSSQIAVRCSQTHLQMTQKASISSTHFTIHHHHHHHHHHRFSSHQQKFTRIVFITSHVWLIALPCQHPCHQIAMSAGIGGDYMWVQQYRATILQFIFPLNVMMTQAHLPPPPPPHKKIIIYTNNPLT